MASGVGDAMGMIERVSQAIAASNTAMTRGAVELEAKRLLRTESPWQASQSLRSVLGHVLGLGPLEPLLDDPDTTDILANGPNEIWIERGGELELTDVSFTSNDELIAVVERMIAPLGLRIDRSFPMVAARLPDGSRLHAVLPPASVDKPLLAIRRFTQRVSTLDELVEAGTASKEDVRTLRSAVVHKKTIVVSGGTGAGKTTLLNLLAGLIPSDERVVTIEDAAELALPGHVVRLETRPPNSEGAGEISIRALLRTALRLRPDRIIIGEVRGPEALELVSALNTGHRGSLTTVHANSPQEAVWRLETLALSAGDTSESAIRRQLHAAIDLIVQLERTPEGRSVSAICPIEDLEAEK